MTHASSVQVYAGLAALGSKDLSSPCLKLLTYLRMAAVPYELHRGDPRQGPTKKIPYVVHDGVTLGDSSLIIAYLKRTFGDPLDARLTDAERALGHVIQRTLEESLYWALVHARWTDDALWPEFRTAFRQMLPPVIGGLLMGVLRKQAHKSLWGQGLGRHQRENVEAFGCADIDAIAELLGATPYLFGELPTSFDASLYATLSNILAFPPKGRLAAQVRRHPGLMALVARVEQAYYA